MATKVEFVFDPFELTGLKVPKESRAEALEQAREVLRDEIISSMDAATSPVSGYGKFPGLSSEYKKKKVKLGGSPTANLELDGDLKDSIKVTKSSGGRLKVTVSSSQQGKADGHCNFSGKSNLPLRRFIPNEDDGETFKKSIIAEIASAIEPFAEDE